jgi:membrane-bound ClpP family serine protease
MSVTVILALIILGILLLLVEFLVIPGITIAGIAGTLLVIGGVISGYYYHQAPVGHYIMISTLTFILLLFVTVFKTKTWQKLGLKTSIDGHLDSAGSENFNVGDIGKSVSRLAPIGKVMINNIIIEARSMGGYIDANKDIVIVRTEKNKLFVELK